MKYVRWGRTTCPSGAQIVYKGKGDLQLIVIFVAQFEKRRGGTFPTTVSFKFCDTIAECRFLR